MNSQSGGGPLDVPPLLRTSRGPADTTAARFPARLTDLLRRRRLLQLCDSESRTEYGSGDRLRSFTGGADAYFGNTAREL